MKDTIQNVQTSGINAQLKKLLKKCCISMLFRAVVEREFGIKQFIPPVRCNVKELVKINKVK